MNEIVVRNAPHGLSSSPLCDLCHVGNFPAKAADGVISNWKDCTFASVSQVAAVASVQRHAHHLGLRQSIRFGKPEITAYMKKMGYFECAGIVDESPRRQIEAEVTVMPLSAICGDDNTNEIPARLRTTVTGHLDLDDSAIDTIDLTFSEVLNNVRQHSGDSISGLAAAQYHPNKRYVEACIVDCGVGIAASMADNPAYAGLSNYELLAKAFEEHTGQYYALPSFGTAQVSGGRGLHMTFMVLKALNGIAWVISHGDAMRIENGICTKLEDLYYPGTIVCMRYPITSKKVTGNDLFGNGIEAPLRWNQSDSYFYDDRDDYPLW
ncbi:hypothetical protein M1L65_06055 [Slackia exigua]|uniref:hypothetical protein n=1 Tax=Slackia exigua TaxID=84109 RepID=UPI003B9EF41E